jgi:two-component system NtrC family sensor kinase
VPVNLRTKLTLTVSALLITSVFGIVYLSLLYYEHQSKQVIAAQQLTMLHALAHELDNKLATAQDILVSASRVVPPEALRDPEAAQHFLDQRVELHALFDNHLFLFTPEGRLIAESPFLPNRRRLDLSDREYIRRTVAERKPYISEPYVSTQAHKHPVVMFTAPLLDSNGRVSGLLGGSVDLLGHNFLGRLAESTVGARGYFYLINDQRTLIVHHDTERVLTRVPPGKNRALDRTLAEGFEGSAETITSTGVPALASFQRLHVKPNWVLAASYPLDEAYAPIYRMRQRVFWGTVLGIVLIFLASALVIRYLTGPLRQLTADVQALAVQGGGTPLAEPGRGGELDELARSVNRLLEDLNLQKSALQQSEQHYRIIADFSTHLAFWRAPDAEIRYIAANCADLIGYPDSDFYQHPGLLDDIVHPEDRSLWLTHWEQVRAGTRARHGPLELRLLKRDGSLHWMSHTCQPVVDQAGAFQGVRGSHADITERKQAEQALRESEERLAEAIRIARLGSWRLDLQSGDFTVSPEHLNIMGYGADAPPDLHSPRRSRGDGRALPARRGARARLRLPRRLRVPADPCRRQRAFRVRQRARFAGATRRHPRCDPGHYRAQGVRAGAGGAQPLARANPEQCGRGHPWTQPGGPARFRQSRRSAYAGFRTRCRPHRPDESPVVAPQPWRRHTVSR